ncbi:MAG: TRAP transporter substrate-binding protein [Lachnospiraceae bacterium]|nr:TRAP transporter substrate-binding protein [Lachnospiraceae bacterium]
MSLFKKVISLAIISTMALSFVGCGGSTSESKSASSSSASSEGAESSSAQISEEPTVKLTLNHDGSTDHPYNYGSEKLAELASQYSNGSIQIEVYPASQIASGTKAVEFVQMGTLDIALCASTSMVNFVSEFGVIDMPFLFKDKDEVFKILDGEIGNEISAKAEAAGFKVLGWADNGFKCVSNSVRPIRCLEDYKGLKIRVPETDTFIKMYESLGAVPTAMAVGEVYTAIQTGVVVGQDNTVGNFVSNKYSEVQDYLTISNHIYTAEPFVMSVDKFNSLTSNQQQALMRATKEACAYEREVSLEKDKENLKAVEDAGVEIAYIDEDELPKIKESVQTVYDLNADKYGEMISRIQEELSK